MESSVGGSGVVIDAEKNLVLTNAHVVQGITALKAVTNDGAETPRGCSAPPRATTSPSSSCPAPPTG
ncbi:MAG: hypothetical protein M3459_04030 [Actinomycetota bacterium]|nr:hypothetical protein [Actinomycetota bacterium]